MSHLQLVKSFTPAAYPFHAGIDVGFDPENNHTDRLFKDHFFYREEKLQNQPIYFEEEIRALFTAAKVEDYCLFRNGTHIDVYMKGLFDYNLMKVHFLPTCENYIVDFFECPKNASPRKMKKRMKQFQEAFDSSTDLYPDTRFQMDPDRKMIRAKTSSKETLAKLITISDTITTLEMSI